MRQKKEETKVEAYPSKGRTYRTKKREEENKFERRKKSVVEEVFWKRPDRLLR